ncbi:MAG: hypothetical protein CFE23_06245 [Flavobacterium sp. BFFFF1]|uniref:hypothetical protein n=1 Tax=Flavobacterium sp. BFFFF1 TaxID=2015557 RepID=UPI000BDAABEE|nr:hypothetical protein [Flavobacterium sp. BFFFF1]OYU81089.1 MAG: hypothetical protein CFE23_06245 [Flavobacterium sp. BFFFF1]
MILPFPASHFFLNTTIPFMRPKFAPVINRHIPGRTCNKELRRQNNALNNASVRQERSSACHFKATDKEGDVSACQLMAAESKSESTALKSLASEGHAAASERQFGPFD